MFSAEKPPELTFEQKLQATFKKNQLCDFQIQDKKTEYWNGLRIVAHEERKDHPAFGLLHIGHISDEALNRVSRICETPQEIVDLGCILIPISHLQGYEYGNIIPALSVDNKLTFLNPMPTSGAFFDVGNNTKELPLHTLIEFFGGKYLEALANLNNEYTPCNLHANTQPIVESVPQEMMTLIDQLDSWGCSSFQKQLYKSPIHWIKETKTIINKKGVNDSALLQLEKYLQIIDSGFCKQVLSPLYDILITNSDTAADIFDEGIQASKIEFRDIANIRENIEARASYSDDVAVFINTKRLQKGLPHLTSQLRLVWSAFLQGIQEDTVPVYNCKEIRLVCKLTIKKRYLLYSQYIERIISNIQEEKFQLNARIELCRILIEYINILISGTKGSSAKNGDHQYIDISYIKADCIANELFKQLELLGIEMQ